MKRILFYITLVIVVLAVAGCAGTNSIEKDTPSESAETSSVEDGQEAVNIVAEIVGDLPEGYHLRFDHKEERDHKQYFVVQHYESVIDDPETGEGHTATSAWYYVEETTGNVYTMDIAKNELIPESA